MTRVALALPILVVLAGQGGDRASAQASWPFQLEWQSNSPIGTLFKLCVDGTCSGLPASPRGGTTWRAPLPLLPAGEHRLVVQACGNDGCVDGTPDMVVRVTKPSGAARQPPIDVITGPRIPLPPR